MLKAVRTSLLKSAILVIVLVSGSPLKAADPDTLLASRIVKFSIASEPAGKSAKMNCTGTLLNSSWMMTAAHCIEPGTRSITVRCEQNGDEPVLLTRSLQSIDKHNSHDIVLLEFEQHIDCRQSASVTRQRQHAVSLVPDSRIATSLFTFSLADNARHSLVLLEAGPHTYIVDDEQCLTQGDSGTPAFTIGRNNHPELAAVLVSGTSDCPALQILANVSDFSRWVGAGIQVRQ